MADERELPDAGEEWVAKAILLDADVRVTNGMGGYLWTASVGNGKDYFGVTKARACRKLVRAIIGDTDGLI